MAIPIIIPLGAGSFKGNWELRFLLRSIDRHLKGAGEVCLVTQYCPGFINRNAVKVLNVPDLYHDNKDANLWRKTLAAIRALDAGKFIFCADDNCFMQDIQADQIPVLHNPRGREHFVLKPHTAWRERMRNTLEWAERQGFRLECNYDCHAPQLFDGGRILAGMDRAEAEFVTRPGLCIYTVWRVLEGVPASLPQASFKTGFNGECAETLQAMSDADLCARPLLGYNDGFVVGGGLERLQRLFPEPCKYEVTA